MSNTYNPVLYLILRNDMASMNMGKGIAQGSHATDAFRAHIGATLAPEAEAVSVDPRVRGSLLFEAFYEWKHSTQQNCGTVLVLEGAYADLQRVVGQGRDAGYVTGIFHDPTYPVRDGDVTHYIPVDTCAYFFVPDKGNDLKAEDILSPLPLHR